jgi:radical SAM superfamily enzyme YgiQ (UPF0313 family)
VPLKTGIEYGSEKMLDSMDKRFSLRQAADILALSARLGIMNRLYFTVGYPHETREDVDCTIRFIRENKNNIHSFSIYRFHLDYGSPIWDDPKQYGLENLRETYSDAIAFDEIGGLKYKDKMKQQTETMLLVLKSVYRELLADKYGVGRMSFYLYYLWEKGKTNFLFAFILKSLPLAVFSLAYRFEPGIFASDLLDARYGIYIARGCFPFQRLWK